MTKFVISYPQPILMFKLDWPNNIPVGDLMPRKNPINAKGNAKMV
jgi:hypothetical protein